MPTVRVFFLDNGYMTFSVANSESVGDLREKVSRKLRLRQRQADCFELFCAQKGAIPGIELARDAQVMSASSAKGVRLLYAARQIGHVLVGVRRRKHCLRLAYAQAVFNVISGNYACDADTAVTLAALHCRAALNFEVDRGSEAIQAVSDALGNKGRVRFNVDQLIPRPLVGTKSKRDWQLAILDEIKGDGKAAEKQGPLGIRSKCAESVANNAKGGTRRGDEYRGQYLSLVERWPSYGVSLFPCAEIAVYRASRSNDKVASAQVIARSRGDVALGISRSFVGFYISRAPRGSRFGGRFFDAAARRATFELHHLKRWGHRAGVEFYVDLTAAASQVALLDLLRHDAMSPISTNKSRFFNKKSHNTSALSPSHSAPATDIGGLRVSCISCDGSRAAILLRDYALAKLGAPQHWPFITDGTDESTTDYDSDKIGTSPCKQRLIPWAAPNEVRLRRERRRHPWAYDLRSPTRHKYTRASHLRMLQLTGRMRRSLPILPWRRQQKACQL